MQKFLLIPAMLVYICAGIVVATSPAKAGEVRQLLKNNSGWHISVTMRSAPTYYGKEVRIINSFRWPDTRPEAVELTGKIENGWVEILYPTNDGCDKHGRSHCRQAQGWIFGEFVGILPKNTEYVEFKKPKDFKVIRDRVVGRSSSTILSGYHEHHWDWETSTDDNRCCAFTFYREDRITVIGKKGRWFKVSGKINGKPHHPLWVYDELVKLVN